MRLLVASVGKAGPGPERDLIERYAERSRKAGRALGITRIDLLELPEGRARSVSERKLEEAIALARALPQAGALIALDEHGAQTSSDMLARYLDVWRQSGVPNVAFVIGGPDGLDTAIVTRADHRIAFGAATWPHLLVRAMLLEQIYRAITILSGHPYHRP